MKLDEYKTISARDLSRAVLSGDVSAAEVTRLALELAESIGRKLNAVVTICEDKALERARKIDTLLKKNQNPGRLAGVPVIIKDNISYKDVPCTCGSKMLEDYVPVYNSTCVERLLNNGAIIIATSNMDEFGMGSSNENSIHGPVKNPAAEGCVPGGSSGGSAAAVAAGIVPLAFGSDTGGSIRQPAAFCGVAGHRPTYGTVSRYGLVSFASSFDQIGPLARTVEDCALAFSAIAGHDDNDATSVRFDFDISDFETKLDGKKLRIGVLPLSKEEGLSADIQRTFFDALDILKETGHHVFDVELEHLDYAVAAYYLIANAEASANLARYDGVRFGRGENRSKDLGDFYERVRGHGFGNEVKRRIMLGTFALSTGYYDRYYAKAQKVRELIRADFASAFTHVDIIVSPTTPTAAFRFGEKLDDPLAMYLSDILTVPASLAGIPAISIPCRTLPDNRPAGLQIMAPEFCETLLFEAARAFGICFSGSDQS
jgi:aspartyl-tRNA(Asn)/glutamyl-tRNA(Gln) amidotransferase subunit A